MRVYAEVDDHEWADGYSIDGIKIDTSGFLTSTIDRYIAAALDRADVGPELQVRITARPSTPSRVRPHLDLDPQLVKAARSLAKKAGRPIVRLAQRHTTVSVERATLRLAGLEGADAEPELQVRITALLHGRVLHGQPVIDAWRARCAVYPSALAKAMVDAALDLRPRDRLEMLAARADVFLLHRDLVDNVQGVMDALFGLNRVYAPHPFHKWLDWEVTLLRRAPVDLVGRIRRLLAAQPSIAIDELSSLIEETFDLVEKELPAYDVEAVRTGFAARRTGSG